MAKEILTEEFQDDILAEEMNGLRKYKMIDNGDSTVSFVDVTQYETVGTEVGAAELKRISKNINESADKNKIIDDLEVIKNVTEDGYIAGAKAVGDLNNSLVTDIYVGDDGKLHKIVGGADSVLPFSNGFKEVWVKYNYSSVSCMDSDGNILHNRVNIYNKNISGNYLNVAYGNSNYTITALQDCTVTITRTGNNYTGDNFDVISFKTGDTYTEWNVLTGSLFVF